nr:copia protein [Tanacetum cinerariifolium]
MIKYSFRQDEEDVVVKEDEYEDWSSTRKDACRAYKEIFRMVEEGYMENPETKLCEVILFEKQSDNLKKRLAKNDEAKMVIYNALPRKEYERIFICSIVKEIWKILFITNQDESIDSAFAIFNTIITSLKVLDEGYSIKNDVKKFLRALHSIWTSKVMAFEYSKDLTSLSLDELIGNLKVKKKSSNEEYSTFESKDKRGSWSDSGEKDDEETKDETCLVAQASNEVCSNSSYFSDEKSSIDELSIDKEDESFNLAFDETPPPSKTSPLVDDELDEEEAIKVTEKKNLENDIEDETLEIYEIVNIKESRNHPLENVIGNITQRTFRNMTIIGTKWVFRIMLDKNGIVSQNKGRLVAQGYNQQEGINYDKTYTPFTRLESIRILLAFACALDFKLFQMDVKSEFLNGFISEEVKEYQENDKIGSKLNKNEKRGEAEKSQKQLQWIKKEKLKKRRARNANSYKLY